MLNKTMNKAASDDAKRVARIALEKRSVTLAQLHTNSNGLSTEEAADTFPRGSALPQGT